MLASADADIVRRDPAIPGLALVLDPTAFTTALRSSMPDLDVREVNITYVRYKPRTNCLVSCRFSVAGKTVEGYAKAYGFDDQDKLDKTRRRGSVSGLAGPGLAVLKDHAVAVSIFPNDHDIVSLAQVIDPAARQAFLREILPDRPDLWRATIRPLRYKPERRYVAQLTVADTTPAVLKLYADPGYQAARGRLAAPNSQGPLRVPRQLGRSDRRRALVFEWLTWPSLAEAVASAFLDVGEIATAGLALAELHGQAAEGWTCLTREAEVSALLTVADGLGFISPDLGPRASDIARRIGAYLLDEPLTPCPIHGDFHADQVLIGPDAAAFIDFDRAVRGDPASDLGLFVAHLERDAVGGRLAGDRVDAAKAALVEGYRDGGRHPSLRRIEVYTAAGLLGLSHEPFRYRRPNWPEETELILERAETIVGALHRASIPSRSDDDGASGW